MNWFTLLKNTIQKMKCSKKQLILLKFHYNFSSSQGEEECSVRRRERERGVTWLEGLPTLTRTITNSCVLKIYTQQVLNFTTEIIHILMLRQNLPLRWEGEKVKEALTGQTMG